MADFTPSANGEGDLDAWICWLCMPQILSFLNWRCPCLIKTRWASGKAKRLAGSAKRLARYFARFPISQERGMFKHSRDRLTVGRWFAVRLDRAFPRRIDTIVTILQAGLPKQMWKQSSNEALATIKLRRLIDEKNAASEIALSD